MVIQLLGLYSEGTPTMAHPFSEEEYRSGRAALKNNKAAGRDDVLVEQLKHLGPNANKWLHTMINVCFTGNKIPKIWRQFKIIAILKPGKDSAIPKKTQTILPLMPYLQIIRRNEFSMEEFVLFLKIIQKKIHIKHE